MTWSVKYKWRNKINLIGYKFMLLNKKLSNDDIHFNSLLDDKGKIIGTQIFQDSVNIKFVKFENKDF